MSEVCTLSYHWCDGRCQSLDYIHLCDGRPDCIDGTDEMYCKDGSKSISYQQEGRNLNLSEKFKNPGLDIVIQTILPTILGCILLVAAMLYGIKKCKEWELDRIVQMRRTRRIVQRITDQLRQKNMQTLQTMRTIRQRRAAMAKQARLTAERENGQHETIADERQQEGLMTRAPPPVYDSCASNELSNQRRVRDGGAIEAAMTTTGSSPPPPYEEAMMDEYFEELFDRAEREMNLPEFSWTYEGLRRNIQRSQNNSRRASQASTLQSLHSVCRRGTNSRMSRRSSNFSMGQQSYGTPSARVQNTHATPRGQRSASQRHGSQDIELSAICHLDSGPNTLR